MGDFNEILYPHEKCGGQPRDIPKMIAFRDSVNFCGLEDLGFSGHHFTWTNGQGGIDNIQERLDRSLANSSWIAKFPNFSVQHLVRHQSDHCPLWLLWSKNSFSSRRRGRKKYRFEAMWLQDEMCESIVESSWTLSPHTSSSKSLVQKLSVVSTNLQQWEKNHFGNVAAQISSLRGQLEHLQKANPTSSNVLACREVEKELRSLMRKEESMWMQRSRASCLAGGDQNTAFFHRTASGRKKRNLIERVRDIDGQWTDDETNIERIFLEYFQKIFSSEETVGIDEVVGALSPKVSVDMNDQLTKSYTEEDVVFALKQMHPLKAPGPDGTPALFYSHFWPTVKKNVLHVVLRILNEGVSPEAINHTHITLVPKKKISESPSDFRPISLCNVAFKLVTKCITNRLKSILPLHH